MIILILVLVILVLVFVAIDIHDITHFVKREYIIDTDKVDAKTRIVLLSDMHNKQFGKNNERLISAIKEIDPDFICCAGDMLTARPGVSFTPAIDLFKELTEYTVYYGIGNHEYRMKRYPEVYGDSYERFTGELKDLGVIVLENEHVRIADSNIRIQGLMIDRAFYKRFKHSVMTSEYIYEIAGKKSSDEYEIMLAHNPEYFDGYAASGADLVFSGHVHGGIMRLPVLGGVISPRLTLFPKYDGGIFKKGDSTMILSRGLGCHTLPLRIFNPGELICVTLSPCKKEAD